MVVSCIVVIWLVCRSWWIFRFFRSLLCLGLYFGVRRIVWCFCVMVFLWFIFFSWMFVDSSWCIGSSWCFSIKCGMWFLRRFRGCGCFRIVRKFFWCFIGLWVISGSLFLRVLC